MQKKFKPEYKTNRSVLYALVILITILSCVMSGILIVINGSIWIWGTAVALTTCWPLLFYCRIKREPIEIVFNDMIVLNFGKLGQKYVQYSDITQFGIKTIRGNNFVISIIDMKNFDELFRILEELVKNGRIDKSSLKTDTIIKETADFKTATIIFPIFFIVIFQLIFFGFIPENIPPKIFGLIIFLCCYFVVYSIIKNRIRSLKKNQD